MPRAWASSPSRSPSSCSAAGSSPSSTSRGLTSVATNSEPALTFTIAREMATTAISTARWNSAGPSPPTVRETASIQPGSSGAPRRNTAHAQAMTTPWATWSRTKSAAGTGVQAEPRLAAGRGASCMSAASSMAAASTRFVQVIFVRSMTPCRIAMAPSAARPWVPNARATGSSARATSATWAARARQARAPDANLSVAIASVWRKKSAIRCASTSQAMTRTSFAVTRPSPPLHRACPPPPAGQPRRSTPERGRAVRWSGCGLERTPRTRSPARRRAVRRSPTAGDPPAT